MKKRNEHLDALRFILVFLIILVHVCYITEEGKTYVFAFFTMILLPPLIFLTGYFSKSVDWNKYWTQSVRYVESYLVIQILFTILIFSSFDPANWRWWALVLLNPHWVAWYFLALVVWRLIPLCVRPKGSNQKLLLVIASVVVALAFGFFPQALFDKTMGKTFFYLPFFVMGLVCSRERLTRIIEWKSVWRYAIAIVPLMLMLLLVIFDNEMAHTHIEANYSYAAIKLDTYMAVLYRLLYTVLPMGLIYSALTLTYRTTPSIFAKWGQSTYEIFLFHMHIMLMLVYWMPKINPYIDWCLYLIIPTVVTILIGEFSYKRFLTNPLTSTIDILKKRRG